MQVAKKPDSLTTPLLGQSNLARNRPPVHQPRVWFNPLNHSEKSELFNSDSETHFEQNDIPSVPKIETKEDKKSISAPILGDVAFPPPFAHEVAIPINEEARKLGPKNLIIDSVLSQYKDPNELEDKIIAAFNEGNSESFVTDSNAFGRRIQRDEYRLVHRNNTPELINFSTTPKRLKIYGFGTIEDIGVYKKTNPLFGAHGRYVVNVKPGHCAKAWLGTQAVLLGPGPRVIKHNNFRMDPAAQVNQSEQYIQHGTLHLVRVPKGSIAKVWMGQTPHFLESSDEPYAFDSPFFRFEKTESLSELYIRHGTLHIVRVPEGKVGKIWLGQTPHFLEHASNPYFFDSALFRLEKSTSGGTFEEASERCICHGPLKRLLPRTGEVAVTYNAGRLEIIEPSKDSKPIMINSPSHVFDSFLTTCTQTLIFPSDETKEERKKEGEKRHEYINYDVFRTNDSCDIGVKLLVVYHIKDPKGVLEKLGKIKNIVSHIENIVVADMGNVIQQCSSQNFMSTDLTRVNSRIPSSIEALEDIDEPSEKEFYKNLQDSLKTQLQKDFEEYGIALEKLNIEMPIVLKMSDQSQSYTETNIKVSSLAQKTEIALKEAEMKASEMRIRQQQENEAQLKKTDVENQAALSIVETDFKKIEIENRASLAKVETELKIAQKRAEIQKAKADSDFYTAIRAAEAEQKRYEMIGEAWRVNPDFFKLELAKVQATAISGLKTAMITPDDAVRIYRLGAQNVFLPQELNKAEEI